MHWRAEGRHEYTVLAFIPGSRPFDLFDPSRKGRNKLYVRRVLITEDADILPGWLRFVRLVVDSADLPLNVSREMIQESDGLRRDPQGRDQPRRAGTRQARRERAGEIRQGLGAFRRRHQGRPLRGPRAARRAVQDRALRHRPRIPTATARSRDYVAVLRENQTAIYYLTGDDAKRLAASPQLEGFRARGVEVLLLADPVDAFWVSTAAGFDGKPFKSVSQGAADIKSIALVEGATAPGRGDGRGRDAARLSSSRRWRARSPTCAPPTG